ncbi:MAG: ChbG/HpnK family deacetylase [Planctomycetota bacterium]
MNEKLPTLVEALGYPAGTRVVLFTADEYGECHAMNAAIFEMLAAGTLTSASLGVAYPWAPEAAAFHKEHPELDCGVHLVLTCQHKKFRWGPLSGAQGLKDPAGYMWPSNELVWKNATAEEAYRECRAQVERALALGLDPSHIDPHMGTVRKRVDWMRDVYGRVGREFALPLRMSWPLTAEEREARAFLAGEGVLMSDHMRQMVPGEAESHGHFRDLMISQMRALPSGVTDCYVHPGLDGEELRALVGRWQNRVAEYRLFHQEPALRAAIKEAGIIVTSWRPIRELARKGVRVRPEEREWKSWR